MFEYVHHVHYVVNDLDEAIDYFDKTFGMKPKSVEIGAGKYPNKEAIYQVGVTEVQITEPLNSISASARHLEKHGPGVFHVAWGVSQIDELEKRAVSHGNELRREGVSLSPRGYKALNIEPSTSHGIGFQIIQDQVKPPLRQTTTPAEL